MGNLTRRKRACRERLFVEQGGRCYYCAKEIDMGKPTGHGDHGTIDHRLPLAQGGTNDQGNFVLACFRCNHVKDDMTEAEFRYYMRERRMANV